MKKADYFIIFEDCHTISYEDIKLIKEEKDKSSTHKTNKAIFKTKLQTAEEVNGNSRWYSKPTCQKIVEGLQQKASSRTLFQEIDHPINNFNDDNSFKKRAITISLNNCGSLISEINMQGNDTIATIETLSGFKGPDLRDLLLIDKANIGFSLRMFSKLKPHSTFENVSEVIPPLRPITYDIVTNPSHKGARIVEFLSESDNMEYLFCDNNKCDLDFTTESLTLLKEDHIDLDYLIEGNNTNDLDSIILDQLYNLKPIKFRI